ncbi:unnamed protein product, partial [Prorocentrum cordatum]
NEEGLKEEHARWQLHRAIHGGDVALSKELLSSPDFEFLDEVTSHGLFGTVGGQSILHIAARCEQAEIVKAILACPRFGLCDLRDGFGCTALHLAASQGLSEICGLLLECPRFTNLAAVDTSEEDAATVAAEQGYEDIAAMIQAKMPKAEPAAPVDRSIPAHWG